jgi:hypothetical protein
MHERAMCNQQIEEASPPIITKHLERRTSVDRRSVAWRGVRKRGQRSQRRSPADRARRTHSFTACMRSRLSSTYRRHVQRRCSCRGGVGRFEVRSIGPEVLSTARGCLLGAPDSEDAIQEAHLEIKEWLSSVAHKVGWQVAW